MTGSTCSGEWGGVRARSWHGVTLPRTPPEPDPDVPTRPVRPRVNPGHRSPRRATLPCSAVNSATDRVRRRHDSRSLVTADGIPCRREGEIRRGLRHRVGERHTEISHSRGMRTTCTSETDRRVIFNQKMYTFIHLTYNDVKLKKIPIKTICR